MDPSEYIKLPGAGLRRTGFISVAAGRCRLYLGSDHLLSVDSIYGSEHYKRFYLRDVQAFIVRRTQTGLTTVLIFGGLLAISSLGLLSADPITFGFGSVFSVLFGFIFLVVLIQQLGWGGTCRTWVQTAVQTEELPSLGRRRTCRKVVNRLQPLVLAAQPTAPTTTGQTEPAAAAPPPDAGPVIEPGANPGP